MGEHMCCSLLGFGPETPAVCIAGVSVDNTRSPGYRRPLNCIGYVA